MTKMSTTFVQTRRDWYRQSHKCTHLYALKELHVVLGDKGDRLARPARASCSTDAVDVVLRVAGDVKVDDQVNVRNVEATARELPVFSQ